MRLSSDLPHCIGKTKLYRSFRELPWTNGYYNQYALKGCIFHIFKQYIFNGKVIYIKWASNIY